MFTIAMIGIIVLLLALVYNGLLLLQAGIYPSRYVLQRRMIGLGTGISLLAFFCLIFR
ncbi:MAG: hypothetical protein ACI4XL_08025 [Bacillus sp. (in: firmicutes)]